MFSFARFWTYLRWLWHRSPYWYLLLPLAAAEVCALFFALTIGVESVSTSPQLMYYDMQLVLPWIFMSFLLGTIPIALHLLSRHLAKPQEAVSYFSLPVSTFERFLAFVLALVVIIPLWGIINLFVFYVIAELLRGLIPYPFPDVWSAMEFFPYALAPYWVGLPLMLGIGILRPKRAFLWWVVSGLSIVLIVSLFLYNFDEAGFITNPQSSLPRPADLFGPPSRADSGLHIFGLTFGDPYAYTLPFIIGCLGFGLSAYLGLRHKQA